MRPSSTSARLLGAALALLLSAPALFAQAEKPVFEEWAVLVMDGKQCGFASTVTTEIDLPAGPQFKTVIAQELVVTRLAASMKMTETSKIVEDAEGGVISFEEANASFGSDIRSTGVREGDDLVVSSRGQTKRYHIPRLDALGPKKIREMSLAVPLKPGQAFTFNTFESNYPQAVAVETGSVVGQELHDVRGTKRNLWKVTSLLSIVPGMKTTMWVDDQSKDVEAVTSLPGFGELHAYVADRAECMKEPEGVEIFEPSLLRPQRPITDLANQGQAVYRLTLTDPAKQLILWDQDEQKVLSSGLGTCDVQVTVPRIKPADVTWQLPHADTPELHRYLQSSAYLEVNSPEIQALAKKAVGDEKNPVVAAHLIEKFVRNYITKKDLSIGFASAQETAKSREGDCTEHAVLCAAIGRAAGLPTRCVFGLGYIPPGADEPTVSNKVDNDTGMFGGHVWAEAWIGPDQWVPMDAALNGFDVGHITITKTALEEINPLIDLMSPVSQLMLDLKINVVKTVLKSKMPAPIPPPKPVVLAPTPESAPASPEPVKSPAPVEAPAPAPITPTPVPVAPPPSTPKVD